MARSAAASHCSLVCCGVLQLTTYARLGGLTKGLAAAVADVEIIRQWRRSLDKSVMPSEVMRSTAPGNLCTLYLAPGVVATLHPLCYSHPAAAG